MSRLCSSQRVARSECKALQIIKLSRSSQESVGLVFLKVSASTWIIAEVLPNTLCSRWNEENPSTPIVKGQEILSVNGVSDKNEIQRAFCMQDKLEIVLAAARPDSSRRILMQWYDKNRNRSQKLASPPTTTAGECYEQFCAICMEDLDASEVVADLGCRHAFHQKCLQTWFAARAGSSLACPVCKSRVVTGGPREYWGR
eukprot:TRINITY_DN97146_c0_g1_i1.p1 TRINITY_DN97146_c0_g1~~TRINITY_DN97146_c0_g1_i1.p1  ORF type:complete len:225 (+),score=20.26 TRINITY_DN97146_c0_g1_i1:78-677(+)